MDENEKKTEQADTGNDAKVTAEHLRKQRREPRGYWVVGGVVCRSRQEMIEAVNGFRDSSGR